MDHVIQRLRCHFFVLLFSLAAHAQGPNPSYYYHPATELPWAECYVHQPGGSQQRIPFLPVIDWKTRAPTGAGKYMEDVEVDAQLVFAGNGIVQEDGWNSYNGQRLDYTLGEIDVAGKAVLFCYDSPDSIEASLKNQITVGRRIADAASRNAAAVILFSHQKDYPFLRIDSRRETGVGNIPVISITMQSAVDIRSSAWLFGGESVFEKWAESGKTNSMELITRIQLRFKGDFDNIETDHFTVQFRDEVIPREEMERLSHLNEKSLQFLLDCFQELEHIQWQKLFIGYFNGYDSKTFYTHHWGHGLACDAGVFSVLRGGALDLGTAVHENTHILTYQNWGGSSSFMNEGIAKYTEALATDKNINHKKTVAFLKDGLLFPLEEMLSFKIGVTGIKTDVGYPASGSFIGFLAEEFGLKSVIEALQLESRSDEEKEAKDTWIQVCGKTVSELDQEWRDWLMGKND